MDKPNGKPDGVPPVEPGRPDDPGKPDGVPPVEPGRPDDPGKPDGVPPVETPRREVRPQKPHGGQF